MLSLIWNKIKNFFEYIYDVIKSFGASSPVTAPSSGQLPSSTAIMLVEIPSAQSEANQLLPKVKSAEVFSVVQSEPEPKKVITPPLSLASKKAMLRLIDDSEQDTQNVRAATLNDFVQQLPSKQQEEADNFLLEVVTKRFETIGNDIETLAQQAKRNSGVWPIANRLNTTWSGHSHSVVTSKSFGDTSILPACRDMESMLNGSDQTVAISLLKKIMTCYSSCKVILGIKTIQIQNAHAAIEQDAIIKAEREHIDELEQKLAEVGIESATSQFGSGF
jgi:hypothetical protein